MPRKGNVIGGKYVLEGEVGAGSMGAVWRATHVSLGRPFAVKFLRWYGVGADRLEARFGQEAKLLAAIQHRFVVGIVDFGMTDEAMPYIVMEYLAGQSLADRLDTVPPLPLRDVVDIVTQVLQGLEAVHAAGVVHRDVKPENIVLLDEAGELVPKLVDFGISRMEEQVEEGTPRRSTLTEPGVAIGTPSYMSPEQVRSLPVDRRSDIYSVGVILYQALAGRLPYDAPEAREVMKRVAIGGVRSVAEVRPEIGQALSAVVARAMASHPDERFGSATELAVALLAAVDDENEALPCGSLAVHRAPGALHDLIAGTPAANDGASATRVHVSATTAALPRPWYRASRTIAAGVVGVAAAGALALLLARPAADAAPGKGVGSSSHSALATSEPSGPPEVAPDPAPGAAANDVVARPPAGATVRRRAGRTPAPRNSGGSPPETFRTPGF